MGGQYHGGERQITLGNVVYGTNITKAEEKEQKNKHPAKFVKAKPCKSATNPKNTFKTLYLPTVWLDDFNSLVEWGEIMDSFNEFARQALREKLDDRIKLLATKQKLFV